MGYGGGLWLWPSPLQRKKSLSNIDFKDIFFLFVLNRIGTPPDTPTHPFSFLNPSLTRFDCLIKSNWLSMTSCPSLTDWLMGLRRQFQWCITLENKSALLSMVGGWWWKVITMSLERKRDRRAWQLNIFAN